MFDKIAFTTLVEPGNCYVANPSIFFKALLLEYMATPGQRPIVVVIDAQRNLTIGANNLRALQSLLLYCYENSDPKEYEKGFIETVKGLV